MVQGADVGSGRDGHADAAVHRGARGLPAGRAPLHRDRAAPARASSGRTTSWFPDDVFHELAGQGYLGLKYPEEYGGSDGGYLADAVLTEELARCGSGGLAAGIGAHIGIATPPVWKFGTEEQKQRYLAPAITGEKIAALGITEPGAGSDVAALAHEGPARRRRLRRQRREDLHHQRRARGLHRHRRQDDGAGRPPRHLVPHRRPRRGRDAPSKLDKLGWHASDTATIAYEDVFVPEENLLGREHEGFALIMANFQWERLLMALGAVGAMHRRDREHARPTRRSARRSAARSPATRRSATSSPTCHHRAHRPLPDLRRAAPLRRRRERGAARSRWPSSSPSARAFEVMDQCLQLHGGAGYMREYEIERMARDARLGPIGGGTDEIMREILAKTLRSLSRARLARNVPALHLEPEQGAQYGSPRRQGRHRHRLGPRHRPRHGRAARLAGREGRHQRPRQGRRRGGLGPDRAARRRSTPAT